MRLTLSHHGIDIEVSYRESPTLEYGAGDCDFEILTYDLVDRDEFEQWHPPGDDLRKIVLDATDELMRMAAEQWAQENPPPREIRGMEGLSARIGFEK